MDNELIQHLLLETEGSDGEVEQSDLDLSFGRIVGIRESCCHEELEVLIIRDLLVTDANSSTLVNLLLENRLKRRIELLTDVFAKEPLTVLNAQLELLH